VVAIFRRRFLAILFIAIYLFVSVRLAYEIWEIKFGFPPDYPVHVEGFEGLIFVVALMLAVISGIYVVGERFGRQ
jgi:hypothetical protein